MTLHVLWHGGQEWPNCPLHGSAYSEEAGEIAEKLVLGDPLPQVAELQADNSRDDGRNATDRTA